MSELLAWTQTALAWGGLALLDASPHAVLLVLERRGADGVEVSTELVSGAEEGIRNVVAAYERVHGGGLEGVRRWALLRRDDRAPGVGPGAWLRLTVGEGATEAEFAAAIEGAGVGPLRATDPAAAALLPPALND